MVGSTLVAVTTLGWVVRGLVAVLAMVGIYLFGAGTLRKFKIAPDSEPDPSQVVPVEARFRCIVCGAEVTMTAAQEGQDLEAPRHCREDMARVGPVG